MESDGDHHSTGQLENSVSGSEPAVVESLPLSRDPDEQKAEDCISELSSSSAEHENTSGSAIHSRTNGRHNEEEQDAHDVTSTQAHPIPNRSFHDISGVDLIFNTARNNPSSRRIDLESRLSSRFGRSGAQSSYHRSQPLTSTHLQGFSAMYEDAMSRRSINSEERLRHQNQPRQRPSFMSRHSQPNSRSDESNLSPYYEHTGGWLRLRPQHSLHSSQPRSRYLNSRNSSQSGYSDNTSQEYHHHNHHQHQQHQYASSGEGYGYHSQHQYHSQYFPVPEGKAELQPIASVENDLNDIDPNEIGHHPNAHDSGLEMDMEKSAELEYPLVDEYANAPPQEYPQGPDDVINRETNYYPSNRQDAHPHPQPSSNPEGGSGSHPISSENATSRNRNPSPLSRLSLCVDTQWASPDSKFERYDCRVDQRQGDKSVEIPLFLFQRPHMRAFHFAWMSFFVAFFTWFAIAPLLTEIKDSLKLSHGEIWMSNVFSSAGTVICRIIVGPLCDRFGARWIMASTLIIAAIPVMATGLVNNAIELCILRLLTGIGGSAFVTCQYWTSSMFTREIAGTANSLAAGWGNLGGGVTQVVMGSALFPLFKLIYGETGDRSTELVADRAWRIVCIVPAILSFVMAFLIIKYSDDSPKGNYMKMKRLGLMREVEAKKALKEAAYNINTWILFVHYGCCFGVEVTMTAGAALYFREEFKQTTESAAALASIFGWLNLFARGFGGFVSDIFNVKHGMRGRILLQALTICLEGIFVIAFGSARSLGGAICIMVFFSLMVQSAEVSILLYFFSRCPTRTCCLLTRIFYKPRVPRTVLSHTFAQR